jgi:DNA-binding NarL/FixJ family response regulator
MRVLVVDDSTEVRIRLVTRLFEAGFDVVGQAGTTETALVLAAELHPEAVILDLHLRDGSGLDILPALKARVPTPLIMVLSNAPASAYAARCLALGADLYLDKAGDFDSVTEILAAHRRPSAA